MSNLDTLIQDLMIANRILAKEDVVDAYAAMSASGIRRIRTAF